VYLPSALATVEKTLRGCNVIDRAPLAISVDIRSSARCGRARSPGALTERVHLALAL